MLQAGVEKIVDALRSAGVLVATKGDIPNRVTGMTDDSRSVEQSYMFVAVRGHEQDGHDYLPQALERGASVALVEDPSRTQIPAIVVNNGRKGAAIAAAAAFDYPARSLKLIGVTGTNGKTTTTSICRHLLDDNSNSASIGTIGILLGSAGAQLDGGQGLTTPGPIELQRVLRELIERGVTHVAMEVSSHSLDQGRVDGLEFDAAVFTNLTHDHLDYHGDMESYFAAKAKLLSYLKPTGAAIVNADDQAWQKLNVKSRRISFGLNDADVRAEQVQFTPGGSEWRLRVGNETSSESVPVHLPMIGDVNVYNALGAAAAVHSLGMPLPEIAERLRTLPQVPGRLEILSSRKAVLRDYAHTPDALRRVLQAVRPFTQGKLIALFGCGGDRDRTKRPVMGAIAEEYADVVVVTSDNPRTEDPSKILDEIEAGMKLNKHVRIEDRHQAIEKALDLAGNGDVVLLAGKGHETYQIRGTTKYPFDEKQIVNELLETR